MASFELDHLYTPSMDVAADARMLVEALAPFVVESFRSRRDFA
jgi:hypothetical protein